MNQYEKKILNILLNKYESSKSFLGENKVNQNFTVAVDVLFPKYKDSSNYEVFLDINEAIASLVSLSFIKVLTRKNAFVQKIMLNTDVIFEVYSYLNREPRKMEQERLLSFLKCYTDRLNVIGTYAIAQVERIGQNKQVEYYTGSLRELEDIISACEFILTNKCEIYIRDASIRLFGDSKRLEVLQRKISSLLFQYGNYEEREFVFEECGVVKTPTYVIVKGAGELIFEEERINLEKVGGDISLSTKTIDRLKCIKVSGRRVMTIENLTTFHDYIEETDFVIYLGGFHNQAKRDFLIMIYEQNPDLEYCHFGDIDAGGFYIYRHLVDKTGISFNTFLMDISVLEKYKQLWRELTNQDKKRLISLKETLTREVKGEDFTAVLEYMLEKNCKLEQEALHDDLKK